MDSDDDDEPYGGTPRKYPTSVDESLLYPLTIARMRLQSDLVGLPLVSFVFFKDRILPVLHRDRVPILRDTIDRVYEACEKKKLIINGRFKNFALSPAEIKAQNPLENENTVYANMKKLWEDVTKTAKSILKIRATVEYTHTPNTNPLMERPEGFKPDAISHLIQSKMPARFGPTSRYFLCNAAVLKEDKIFKRIDDILDNISKIILNSNHLIANDPLRRSLYSITVQDSDLRLWFFSRSGGIVSDALNWISNPRDLVEVIVRLSFASHTALGYDESMHRYWIDDQVIDKNLQYMIKVGNKHFRTVDTPLADSRANFFVGQGTRVFAAIETEAQGTDVTEGGPDVAVKVYWPRKDSTLEGPMYKELIKEASKTGDECWFPNVIAEGVAKVTNRKGDSAVDETAGMIDGDIYKEAIRFYPGSRPINKPRTGTLPVQGSARVETMGGIYNAPPNESVTGISDGNYTEDDISVFLNIRWVNRVQYRIAFEGIGTPIADLTTVFNFVRSLRDGVRAVRVLHRIGYVHRDLSIGNFLIHSSDDVPWQLKIYDVEYVRKISKLRNDEQILTGTRQFMSLEVLTGQYLFWLDGRNLRAKENGRELSAAEKEEPAWDFHYNPLHDLEPFFWMLLWFLLYRCPKNASVQLSRKQVNKQLNVADSVFDKLTDDGLPSLMRTGCLQGGGVILPKVLKHVRKEFADVGLKTCVREVADHMINCYTTVEGSPNFQGCATPELLKMSPSWMYDKLDEIFTKQLELLVKDPIEVVDAIRPDPKGNVDDDGNGGKNADDTEGTTSVEN